MSYYNQHPIAKSILDFGPFVYQWELTGDVLLLAADGTHLLWHEGIGPAEQYTWKTKLIFPVWLCQSTPKTPLWYINSSLFCVRGTNQDRHIMSDSFRAVFFIISNNKQQQEVKVECLNNFIPCRCSLPPTGGKTNLIIVYNYHSFTHLARHILLID